MRADVLSPAKRQSDLASLKATSPADPLDVLVVGGGVTGTGAAFDAATRGLKTAVVESRDWASGTSSKSSKLMHGGLRYLEMLDFALVSEALKERDLLLTHTAPHLVTPVSFVFPYQRALIDRTYIGSGVLLYDAMALRPGKQRAVPRHRHLSRKKLASYFPGLSPAAGAGALEYYDAKVDDARFTLTLARTAAAHGAHVLNHCTVLDYLRDPSDAEAAGTTLPGTASGAATGDTPGETSAAEAQVTGVTVRDELTGETFDVHARCTIIAGGVWTETHQHLAGTDAGLEVMASKGIHITVPREKIAASPDVGIITKTEKSVLFVIPWDEYWIIGTTDTSWSEDIAAPVATATDVDYLLEHANAVLTTPLTREDVIGIYAGLRPLLHAVDDSGTASTKVSREHTVMEIAPGLCAIAGGKFTTYRVMAQDAVDFAIRETFTDRESLTEAIPLLGAQGLGEVRRRTEELTTRHGWDERRFRRLVHRYGSLLEELLDIIEQDPSLAAPLQHAPRYLRAEAVHAARAESVGRLDDVLNRRMRLNYEVADRGVAAAAEVAALVAPELGWDAVTREAEVTAYRELVNRTLDAEAAETDAEAVARLSG